MHLMQFCGVFYRWHTIFFLSLMFMLLTGCSSIFFTPSSDYSQTPTTFELAYRDIYIRSEKDHDLILHGWFIPVPRSPVNPEGKPNRIAFKGSVYFLHGNSDNISAYLDAVAWLPEAGYQVFMLDYRGFGQSEGRAQLPQIFDDIRDGFNWLEKQPSVADKPVFVIGQSIGAALAAYLFSEDESLKQRIDGLVFDAGFNRYDDMTQLIWQRHWFSWWLQLPARWVVDARYNPEEEIANLSPTPLLVLHSPEDKIVDYSQGRALYQQAREPKEFVSTHGTHIKTFDYPQYQQKLLQFFAQYNNGG